MWSENSNQASQQRIQLSWRRSFGLHATYPSCILNTGLVKTSGGGEASGLEAIAGLYQRV